MVSSVNLIRRPHSLPNVILLIILMVLTAVPVILTAVARIYFLTAISLHAVTCVLSRAAAAQAAVQLVAQQVPVTKLSAVRELNATMAMVVICVNRIVAMTTMLAPALLYILAVVNNAKPQAPALAAMVAVIMLVPVP